MKKFKASALGGTFDILHTGHFELLRGAAEVSEKMIIGLSSDEFAAQRGKSPINDYEIRRSNLEAQIISRFPGVKYEIVKLDSLFGPGIFSEEIEALVTSSETSNGISELNRLRREKDLKEVKHVVIPLILSKDGQKVSTTRIKKNEIDPEGNLLRK
ncbi:MAG: pantetheine-phosphate adenylyltransferase [Candidatus Micrarchaeota archaeon]|nr:pantetheine-phosphate adenylyltransferase [Candidatus Micrarchaeota archaeon]